MPIHKKSVRKNKLRKNRSKKTIKKRSSKKNTKKRYSKSKNKLKKIKSRKKSRKKSKKKINKKIKSRKKSKHKKKIKSKGSVLFQTENRCGIHTPITSAGNTFSVSDLIHTNNTTWDFKYPKTHRQTCNTHASGVAQDKKKQKKACKKICPKKTYLGYSPRMEDSKGITLQERAWCCYDTPLNKNVKDIKSNYYNEIKKDSATFKKKTINWKTDETATDTFAKPYSTTKPDKINSVIVNILKHNFKKKNYLNLDPTDPAFIEFKYNILSSTYDVEEIGTTEKKQIEFIKKEIENIRIKQSTPDTPLVSNQGDDIFGDLPFEGDGEW
mgnify:CR=1 FL=1